MVELAVPICVTVCYSPAPRQLVHKQLALPVGSTVAQALARIQAESAWDLPKDLRWGVWNKVWKEDASLVLQDGDRLELYRPLRVDPMTARRERFKTQGARSAGLFAQRRPGAKPGY